MDDTKNVNPDAIEDDEDDLVLDEDETPAEDYDTVDAYDMTADDALAVVLAAKPVHQLKQYGIPARTGMAALRVELRSLSDREFKALRKQAEKPTGKKGSMEIDDSLFLRLVVAAAMVSPKIASADVMARLGVKRPDQVVDYLFLPGRIGQIAERVMELSGWDEEGIVDLGN